MDKINENMGKFGKEVKKGLDESYYRFLTLANLAVNKVARPITDGGKYTFLSLFFKACFSFQFH